MNPNQMNVAKAMVARHDLLEDARRSRLQARQERRAAKAAGSKAGYHPHPLSALLGLGLPGRR